MHTHHFGGVGKVFVITLFTFAFGLLAQQNPVAAASAHAFNLDRTSANLSDIYWSFPRSSYADPGKWAIRGYGHGDSSNPGDHVAGDYYAEDWGLPGNSDCLAEVKSPISGTVIFAGLSSVEANYGRQIVIRSDTDSTFAFRVAHLTAGSIQVGVNQKVAIGDFIGRVGNSGNSKGCHAHVALYRNLDQPAIDVLRTGGFLASSNYAAEFLFDANYVASCPLNQFKGEYFSNVDLYGDPAFTDCTKQIDYSWLLGNIGGLNQKNSASVRWQGQFELASASYKFSTFSTDGVRLWVDNQLIIDDWNLYTSPVLHSADVTLDNGVHSIKLEYLAASGRARVALVWQVNNLINHAPIVTQIPSQTVSIGNGFTVFDLDSYGSDPDIGDHITWSYTGNSQLSVAIDAQNMVIITAPADTLLSENITFTATDTHGASASSTATFTVNAGCNTTIASGDVGAFVLAMDSANSNADPTTICLTAGTPYSFATVHNQIYGQSGLPIVSTPITIYGMGATLQRDTFWNVGMRYFAVSPNGNLTLKDLYINNGVDISNSYGGGAILNNGGAVIVNNVIFNVNKAYSLSGGAISNINGGHLTITNSQFVSNRADSQGSGGAISNKGTNSSVNVSNSTFQTNYGDNNGGAIYNQGTLISTNNSFANNSANNHGGAIFQYSGTSTITGGAFQTNRILLASPGFGFGGAIYNNTGATLSLDQVNVTGNQATVDGGAVYNLGTALAHQSCFVGNNHNAVVGNGADFTSNWWGSSTGPAPVGGGDSVLSATYNPFLTTAPAYCL